MRKMTTLIVSLLLLTATLGVTAVVFAKKPPKPPPPPPPAGTIYFVYDDGSGATFWTMKADGSEKTQLDVGSCDDNGHTKFGILSRIKHGDHYWIIRFCGVEGTYPDGKPRREVFAVRDDNTMGLQLTDDPYVQTVWYKRNLAWGVDDLKISWGAKRWVCDPDCEITEFGIYNATVTYDGNGDIVGVDDPVLVWDTGYFCGASGCHPDIAHLDWSPDGDQIAYAKVNLDLYVVDLGSSSESYLRTGESPKWSPDGNKIAFKGDNDLRTINPDGTGEQILVKHKDTGRWDQMVQRPEWSPDSEYLAYNLIKYSLRGGGESDIYRIGADGSDKTCLTDDLDYVGYSHGWR